MAQRLSQALTLISMAECYFPDLPYGGISDNNSGYSTARSALENNK